MDPLTNPEIVKTYNFFSKLIVLIFSGLGVFLAWIISKIFYPHLIGISIVVGILLGSMVGLFIVSIFRL